MTTAAAKRKTPSIEHPSCCQNTNGFVFSLAAKPHRGLAASETDPHPAPAVRNLRNAEEIEAELRQNRIGVICYGDEITSTGNDHEKFATYTRDSYTGLDYADQRYYASTYGRFNTPDPYVAAGASSGSSNNPGDPGSWNRYSYTRGDPVNRIDPRGTCDIYVFGFELNEDFCGTASGPDFNPSSYAECVSVPSCGTALDAQRGGGGSAGIQSWTAASALLDSALGLLNALAGPNALTTPECESDLSGIQKDTGLTIQNIALAASTADFVNGMTTSDLYKNLFLPGSSDYQNAGNGTIARVMGQPNASTQALAALPGSANSGNIYFNPAFVNNHSVGYNAALLLHESIHLDGYLDPALLGALDLNPDDPITDHATALLAKDCFGVLR